MTELETASVTSERCGHKEKKQNCEFTQGQNVSKEAVVDRNGIFTNSDKNVGLFFI